jgi:hypothetical protein
MTLVRAIGLLFTGVTCHILVTVTPEVIDGGDLLALLIASGVLYLSTRKREANVG